MAGSKKNHFVKALIFGTVSAALYGAIYVYQSDINENFVKGGWYAFLPIVTAFIFSFAHGNFTGSFWSALGVEASKKGAK